jgi:hypothetical protein
MESVKTVAQNESPKTGYTEMWADNAAFAYRQKPLWIFLINERHTRKTLQSVTIYFWYVTLSVKKNLSCHLLKHCPEHLQLLKGEFIEHQGIQGEILFTVKNLASKGLFDKAVATSEQSECNENV